MTPEQLQDILENLRETQSVEVKNWLGGCTDNDHKARLAKEIIGLANHGGGIIVIGFQDEHDGNHEQIIPDEAEAVAFSNDAVSNIVERFISPPLECEVYLREYGDTGISHPIVVVPDCAGVPRFACRTNNAANLRQDLLYIRRPGARTEAARNQDDWESFLNRIVRHRMVGQADAIRRIIEGAPAIQDENDGVAMLDEWISDCRDEWFGLIDQFPEDDPRRLAQGFWHVAFDISDFRAPNIRSLLDTLREARAYSGWRPFVCLNREGMAPQPYDNGIWAYTGDAHYGRHFDFWKFSMDGKAFLLRPYQEDDEDFAEGVRPAPARPFLDWGIPIYRLFEITQTLLHMGRAFANDDAEYLLKVTYEGVRNRYLWSRPRYGYEISGPIRQNTVSASVRGHINQLDLNANEAVMHCLSPIYAQFSFAELREGLVNAVIDQARQY